MRMSRMLVVALFVAATLGASQRADALAYSFDADLGTPGLQGSTVNAGGLSITLNPVLVPQPSLLAGSPIDGTVTDPFGAQDWFVFSVTVNSGGSLAAVGVGNPISLAVGAGFEQSTGVDPSAIDATNPAPGTADTPLFSFSSFSSGTSDTLVVAFTTGDLPGTGIGPIPAGTVSFMIDNGTNVFSFDFPGGVTLVPEPTTAVLLGGGLVLLAIRRRRV